MNEVMKNIIYSSINNLFDNQPELFFNTDQTNFTEWNLSHHLSNEIARYLYWFNVDLDVTKRNYNNNRPDIIFHKRKVNSLNFLVVELKKSRYDNQSDIRKIKEDWMSEPLNYRYGAYINIWDLNQYKAMLFERNGYVYEINDSCNYIEAPLQNKQILFEYKTLTNEIMSPSRKADVKKITYLIDSFLVNSIK
jgi:hypothetical protein